VAHGPTRTSRESAAARGEPLEVGGKSLLLKVGQEFCLCVLSAARRLDSNAVRRRLGARGARFATRAELLTLTGLVPGSVPPFGEPVLPVPLLLDEGFLALPRIAFNAASLEHSVVLATEDYLRVARPTLARFARPADDADRDTDRDADSGPPGTSEPR
jgi:prolyl-tRNA editing enzyme YbaK/EbsC (Cys-tRNA(Pro) deacylase)